MTWTKLQKAYFIVLFRIETILYDRKHPHYYQMSHREKAYIRITEKLALLKPRITGKCLKLKKKNLQIN